MPSQRGLYRLDGTRHGRIGERQAVFGKRGESAVRGRAEVGALSCGASRAQPAGDRPPAHGDADGDRDRGRARGEEGRRVARRAPEGARARRRPALPADEPRVPRARAAAHGAAAVPRARLPLARRVRPAHQQREGPHDAGARRRRGQRPGLDLAHEQHVLPRARGPAEPRLARVRAHGQAARAPRAAAGRPVHARSVLPRALRRVRPRDARRQALLAERRPARRHGARVPQRRRRGRAHLVREARAERAARQGRRDRLLPGDARGKLDDQYLHAAEPAVDIKWVSQIWIRQTAYNGRASTRLKVQL